MFPGVLEGLKAASVGLIMSAGGTILLLTFCSTFDWHAIAEVDFPSILLFGAALFVLRKWENEPHPAVDPDGSGRILHLRSLLMPRGAR